MPMGVPMPVVVLTVSSQFDAEASVPTQLAPGVGQGPLSEMAYMVPSATATRSPAVASPLPKLPISVT